MTEHRVIREDVEMRRVVLCLLLVGALLAACGGAADERRLLRFSPTEGETRSIRTGR